MIKKFSSPKNDPPRGKTARYQGSEIEELELRNVFLSALILDIDTNHIQIGSFADRCHKESVCPEFAAPKFSFQIRMALEHLSRRDALDDPDDLGGRELWGCADEIMDVIRVYPDLFKYHAVSLFNFCTCLTQGLLTVRKSKYRFTVLYRCYEVIVDLVGIVL